MLLHQKFRGLALLLSTIALQSRTVAGTTPFDGQYIQPNVNNPSVEWWWIQAIGSPEGNNAPSAFQMLFYQGYPFGPPPPNAPEFYIDIKGFFPNNTPIALTIPASSAKVTADGEKVTGIWGDVGRFTGSADLQTWTSTFTAPDFGLEGTVKLTSNGPHHFGCNTTTDPYFTSAAAGLSLNDAEKVFYNTLGWATAIPGGTASVDVLIDGSPLKFVGQGYHDANWSPQPLNEIVSTWYFGSGSVGPYDFSYISVTPIGTQRSMETGFLSRDGVILQNQCGVQGSKSNDISVIIPYGLQHDTVAGVDVPAGYIINYVLENNETFSFNLTSNGAAQNPDQPVYHRWAGTASGGKVGEKPYKGLTVFEWLNPGKVAYVPQ